MATKRKNKNRILVVGSGNKHKLKELQSLLRDLNFKIIPITKFKNVPEVEENGRTFAANAEKKARAFSRLSEYLTLADDSGLCVNVLNGKPGIYSARFAGPGCTYQDNNKKLLKLLKGKPHFKRKAYFNSTIALYKQGKHVKTIKGICKGYISDKTVGTKGFGFDPVFIPENQKKTFAQMTQKEKNRISHRGRALKATKAFLRKKGDA